MKAQIITSITMLTIALALLIVGVFVTARFAESLIALSGAVALLATTVLFWAARRQLKQQLVYLMSILISAVSVWLSIKLLDWLSYSRHGDIGPGGGWSIAMGSLFFSFLLGLLLMLSASIAHLGLVTNTRSKANLIPRSHYVLCCIWLLVISLWGIYI